MIQLKLKSQVDNDPFIEKIKPYKEKVIQCLQKTQLQNDLIIPLEQEIYKKTIQSTKDLKQDNQFNNFKDIYINLSRHMIENLKITNQINNIDLIDKVNTKQLTLHQLVNLSPEEMCQKRWQHLIERKELDAKKLISDPEATSELFWCNRCHRNKTTYFQRQDRSADEPMTVHITCCYCGHRWRC